MLPIILYQFVTVVASLTVIAFVLYYIFKMHAKEKELEAKITRNDTEYHKIVNSALDKERKILDDAADEADKIITDAKYVSSKTRETVDKALDQLVEDIKKEYVVTGKTITDTYQSSLKAATSASLYEFQTVSKDFDNDMKDQIKDFDKLAKTWEAELQKKIKTFNQLQVDTMQKQLDAYKESRMQESEKMVTEIIQKISRDVLNRSLSAEDHQKLILDAFERAKREGLFDS